jgi:hypothetical protein
MEGMVKDRKRALEPMEEDEGLNGKKQKCDVVMEESENPVSVSAGLSEQPCAPQ